MPFSGPFVPVDFGLFSASMPFSGPFVPVDFGLFSASVSIHHLGWDPGGI
jgi:hypothetical protein